jgi:hypothetical protein
MVASRILEEARETPMRIAKTGRMLVSALVALVAAHSAVAQAAWTLSPQQFTAQFPRRVFDLIMTSLSPSFIDVNGDGVRDLVYAEALADHPTLSWVRVRLSDGQFGFGNVLSYAAGAGADQFLSGDVNGDGRPDLLVLHSTGSTFGVFPGLPGGGLGPRADFPLGADAHFWAGGDLNDDGRFDLVVGRGATSGDSAVGVMLATPEGGYPVPTEVVVGGPVTRPHIADLDNDGDLDLCVTGQPAKLFVLLNDGTGTFGPYLEYSEFSGVPILTQLNNDSLPDIVRLGGHVPFKTRLGLGGGDFGPDVQTPGPRLDNIMTGDIDADGDNDIVGWGNGQSGLSPASINVFRNDGSGDFSLGDSLPGNSFVIENALTDVDTDADLDACFFTSSGNNRVRLTVLENDGDGEFIEPTIIAPPGDFDSIRAHDINGDGQLDLFGHSFRGFTYYLSSGQRTFQGPFTVSVGNLTQNGELGDLDADGDLDLVAIAQSLTTPYTYDLRIRLNNGDGTFAETTTIPVTEPISRLSLGDLDGDGDADVVHRSGTTSANRRMTIRHAVGGGLLAPPIDQPTVYFSNLTFADFDLDGDLDAVSVQGQGAQLYRNTGDGLLEPPVTLGGSGDFWYEVSVGDITGDGYPDLVLVNSSTTHTVTIAENTGDGTFGTPFELIQYPVGLSSVGIGDIDGDSRLDIAFGHSQSVSILRNRGDRVLASDEWYEGSAYDMVLADLDGDDGLDVVGVANNSAIRILWNRNASTAPYCAGDIDGDGFANAADFTILAGNFGATVPAGTLGDLNSDGTVNAADFVILAGDFGCGS